MQNDNAGGWPAEPGVPMEPERDGWHWLHHPEDLRPCPIPWDAEHAAWCSGGMHSPQGVVELGYRYLGPCLTPAEIAAREAAAWCAGRDAAAVAADGIAEKLRGRTSLISQGRMAGVQEAAFTIRALTPPADFAAALEAVRREERERIAGDVRCEAEAERNEFFNRLGRITSELGLPMDCTAGRIIEAIRDAVDDEREACASVSVKVEVPDGAESWSPLEAWEEALLALDEAFRAAIRARGTEGGR